MQQTIESVEAESASLRSQLVSVGGDIRRHADPSVVVDAAKTSFKRRAQGAPSLLRRNATPLAMVMVGGTLGAVVTGMISQSQRAAPASPRANPALGVKSAGSAASRATRAPVMDAARPSLGSTASAALMSCAAIGLGYVAGMFIPTTPTEERLLGEPKTILAQYLDNVVQEHTQGMKSAVANLFGASRWSATALIGLTILAEALSASDRRPNSQRK